MRNEHAFRPTRWDRLEGRVVPSAAVAAADPGVSATSASTPVRRLDAGALQAHDLALALADSGGASNIVFFGDSITARWNNASFPGLPVWESSIAPFGAADFGVDGDRTQNLIWRLQNGELDGKPRVAVVLIGTNNLSNTLGVNSPDDTADGIATVVRTIRDFSPDTRVLLLGLLPRSSPGDPIRDEIEQVNARI